MLSCYGQRFLFHVCAIDARHALISNQFYTNASAGNYIRAAEMFYTVVRKISQFELSVKSQPTSAEILRVQII